jgi:GlcNAc-PI de-N-acetylase
MMPLKPQLKSLPMKQIPLTWTVAMLGILAWACIPAAVAAEATKATKVLMAVLAHPDDDVVCAGTLARAASAGWEVRVIYATSGEAGENMSGQKLKGAALGRERERESRKSLTALGVKRPPV